MDLEQLDTPAVSRSPPDGLDVMMERTTLQDVKLFVLLNHEPVRARPCGLVQRRFSRIRGSPPI